MKKLKNGVAKQDVFDLLIKKIIPLAKELKKVQKEYYAFMEIADKLPNSTIDYKL